VDAAHSGEIDHEPVVADGVAGDGVAAATDRDFQLVLARSPHRRLHVADAPAPGDQAWIAIDHPIVHAPADVVRGIAGDEHVTGQVGTERAGHCLNICQGGLL
jgi:hypothetical protein